MLELGRRCLALILLWVLLLRLAGGGRAPKTPRCPPTCSCTRDSAFCLDTKAVPRSFPPGIISL